MKIAAGAWCYLLGWISAIVALRAITWFANYTTLFG